VPLTFHQRHTASTDPVWVGRVRQAVLAKALAVSTNPTAPNRDIFLAKQVLGAPDRFAAPFAVAAASAAAYGDGTANDPSDDSPTGDTALAAVIETQLWPAFTKEPT
jgi:hypothetical protein